MGKVGVDISSLTKAERLELLEELWDSLEPEEDVPVTPAQRRELRARSRALEAGELRTVPVDDLLEAIRSRRAAD